MQGATSSLPHFLHKIPISIHAPYAGGDYIRDAVIIAFVVFQSTPPMQGATITSCWAVPCSSEFQSTPPMQGATQEALSGTAHYRISIHAPYAGGDPAGSHTFPGLGKRFQSTPPMQGATLRHLLEIPFLRYFNPRPLCRGRR